LIRHARLPMEEGLHEVGAGIYEMVFEMERRRCRTGRGLRVVGRLSELYARMFHAGASIPGGTRQLIVDIEPGTLSCLVPTDFKSGRLRL
jgi:hypothetical protein